MKASIPFDEMRSRCRATLRRTISKLVLSMITSIPLRHSFIGDQKNQVVHQCLK